MKKLLISQMMSGMSDFQLNLHPPEEHAQDVQEAFKTCGHRSSLATAKLNLGSVFPSSLGSYLLWYTFLRSYLLRGCLQVGSLGATLSHLVSGSSWLQVGGSWDHLGFKLGALGTILASRWGPKFGDLGGSGGACWATCCCDLGHYVANLSM